MSESGKFEQSKLIRCVPQRPVSIDKCLLEINTGFTHLDDDYVYKGNTFKMKLGRAVKKYCHQATMNQFDAWKNDLANIRYVPIAVKEALYRREFLKEYKHLAGFVDSYQSEVDDDIEFVISDDPVDIVNMSTGQHWSSCTKIGGAFGNAKEWLTNGINCNWCSDIEHGNLILYIRKKSTGKWIGRQSLRWCVMDDNDSKGIGVEEWYGDPISHELEREKDEWLEEKARDNEVAIDFHQCITPYIFGGSSNWGSNDQIDYSVREGFSDPMVFEIENELEDEFKDLADPYREHIYAYNLDEDGTFTTFTVFYNNPSDAFELATLIDELKTYDAWTYNINNISKPIARTLQKKLRENDEFFIKNEPIKFIYTRDQWEDFYNIHDCAKPINYNIIVSKGNKMLSGMEERFVRGAHPYNKEEYMLKGNKLERFTPNREMQPLMAIMGNSMSDYMTPNTTLSDIVNPFEWTYEELKTFANLINKYYDQSRGYWKDKYWKKGTRTSELEIKIADIIKKHTVPPEIGEFYAREYPFSTPKKLDF